MSRAAGWLAREAVLILLVALVFALAVVSGFAVLRRFPSVGGLLALTVVVAVVFRQRRLLRVGPDAPEPPVDARDEWLTAAPFARVSRLGDRIHWSQLEARHFEAALRPLLRLVADDRLRRHHGVAIAEEPEQARALLGESLWRALTARPTGPASEHDIETWVRTLERL